MNEADESILPARVRVMQIITLALLMGVVSFLGIACFIVYGQRQGVGMAPALEVPVFTIVAFTMLATCGVLSFFAPALIIRAATRKIAAGKWQPPPGIDPAAYASDTAKLLGVRQTSLIVGQALLEGPAFLGIIAFLQEAQPYLFAVPAVAIVAMLLRFPTEGGVREWLSTQEQLLSQMRADASP